METRTVNSLPLAAYHDGAVRCLLAIELSKKSWIVAVNTPLSDKVGRHTLRAGDWKGLLDSDRAYSDAGCRGIKPTGGGHLVLRGRL